jgi:predicted RNA binding protein YcfA (HicA-like mRNA interferase family)
MDLKILLLQLITSTTTIKKSDSANLLGTDFKSAPKGGHVIMNQDKRKRTRVAVHFDVTVALGGEIIQARIINISLTGILCDSSPFFQKDAACQVVIALSEDLKISIASNILRVGKQETAISFTAMDEESFAHLKKLVEYNAGDADLIEKDLKEKAFD